MSADEEMDLLALKRALLAIYEGTSNAGVFRYGANGVPSLQALALALALTCRDATELAALRGEDQLSISLEDLVARCAESMSHFDRALAALRVTAANALDKAPPANPGKGDDDGIVGNSDRSKFDEMARAYYETRREILTLAVMHGVRERD